MYYDTPLLQFLSNVLAFLPTHIQTLFQYLNRVDYTVDVYQDAVIQYKPICDLVVPEKKYILYNLARMIVN